MPTRIAIESIVKQYPGNPAPSVDRVSLAIEPGELFFLLGPSGCGKTTLLRMIAGFIDPTAGTIRFAKDTGELHDVTHLPPNQRNTGMVFQSYALWPHMSVAGNVAFGLEVRKVPKAEMDGRVMEALRLVQMEAYAQRKPNALSGGQQQRVALARALVVRPDVLLLDEPLSNLDAKLRVELRGEIRRICKSAGITTVYVTHDQKEALSMADRVAIMTMGKVEQLGGPAELYRRPGSKFVAEFLGETNFLPGRVVGREGGREGERTIVETPFGRLASAAPGPRSGPLSGPMSGPEVIVSIRPEALRVVSNGTGRESHEPGNALAGSVLETTYLGELAQHVVELKPAPGAAAKPQRLKVALLNPAPADHAPGPARPITLHVAPEDVVLVPA